MKTCRRCGQEKDIGEFFKDVYTSDGLYCSCKKCVAEYRSIRWRKNHPKKVISDEKIIAKTCRKCGVTKAVDLFYKHPTNKDGLNSYCKECNNKKNRIIGRRLSAEHKLKNSTKDYTIEEKIRCPTCKEIKSSRLFWKDKNNKNGYQVHCVSCSLKKNYGVDAGALLECQGGKCAICDRVLNKKFYVDHNHGSGVVRGILCLKCNTAIGFLNDDPNLLRVAISYLEQSSAKEESNAS